MLTPKQCFKKACASFRKDKKIGPMRIYDLSPEWFKKRKVDLITTGFPCKSISDGKGIFFPNYNLRNLLQKTGTSFEEWQKMDVIQKTAFIHEAGAVDKHRKHVEAGKKGLSKMLKIKALTCGLKYVLDKPKKIRKKHVDDRQLDMLN